MAIPRVIHQTIDSRDAIHPVFAQSAERLRAMNDGWDYRLYDDADCRDFIGSEYGTDVLASYDRIRPAYGPAKADFFRYLLLYKVGGVYLDIKSTATKKLDDVLLPDDQFILSHWRNAPTDEHAGWGVHLDYPELCGRGEFQQWHVVSAPGHPFLAAVISAVKRNIDCYDPVRDGVGKFGVVKMTGPIAYSLAIHPIRDQYPHRYADAEDIGFVFSILGTEGWKRGPMPHASYFKSHYSFAIEPLLSAKAPPASKAVGRNDPCPCGSGKKYKHCHGRA